MGLRWREGRMPFHQVSVDDQRRLLAHRALVEKVPVAELAREFGVSRPTVYRWIERAQEEGIGSIATLTERSRRPANSPSRTETISGDILALVGQCQARHPFWGARKLHAVLWPPPQVPPICARTVHRLLKRQGLLKPAATKLPASDGTQRFERETCNELWQVDYKGVGLSKLPPPLSVIDDCSRFCVALRSVSAKTGEDAWRVLWEAFGEYGLPECLLCDNGDGFNHTRSLGPTLLQARLWRLAVRTTHGRPGHPQTQGKVERFHRTLALEVAAGGLGNQESLSSFRQTYNWQRPHESLEMRVPGVVYRPSTRQRPADLAVPESFWACSDAVVRKVDSWGKMSYRNRRYRPGHGLAGEWVELREETDELGRTQLATFYAGVRFAALTDLLIA